jgi:hypothetical protein
MLFEIGTGVFSGCTNLTKVTIGNQVTYIAGQPFSGCNSLTEVYFLGNAPGLQMHVIGGAIDNSVTVYYLAGTSGWETSFMGWPTALWNPLIHASGENLGVQTNGFSFNVSGIADQVVVVEACTNLAEGVWVPVETNTLTGGSVQFSDPAFTNYPNRYYRVSMPQ